MAPEFLIDLEVTTKEVLHSFRELSTAQFMYKMNSYTWSIHECMEHVVITEIAVYRIIMQHTETEINAEVTEKIGKEKIEKLLGNRTVKVEAPDDVRPIGRFSSMPELIEKFISNRQRITDAIKGNRIIFSNRIIPHPLLGEMTKKDWLNFLIQHTKRHCRQIEEIRNYIQLQMI